MIELRVRPAIRGAAAVLAASALLTVTACGPEGSGEQPPPTDSPTPATSPATTPTTVQATEASQVTSLDELFEKVDEQLGCPAEASGGQSIMVGGATGGGLPGRQCGDGVVMTWSDDPALIEEAQQLLLNAGGPVPMAVGPDWLVADGSAVAQSGGEEIPEPKSKDLESLAKKLGGEFRPAD